MKIFLSILIPYALMVIVTFGYSYNVEWEPTNSRIGESDRQHNLEVSLGRSLFWPFYWSVKNFEHLRP